MSGKPIPLSRTYEALGVSFNSVSLREPTGVEYWSIGPIAEWQPVGEGAAQITYHEKVREYVDRLIQPPQGLTAAAALGVLSLGDTLKVERAVKDFFTEANKSAAMPTS